MRRSDLLREAGGARAESRDADSRVCATRTRRWRRASPRRSPIACSAARASFRGTSPSADRPSGAATAGTFHRKWHEELESGLEELQLGTKLKRVDHHLSHAANAFYTSGFDEALIVTLDGYGSGLAGSVSIGRDGAIERVHGVEFPHSLGTFYESVTSGLGFQPSRHEGKIVGLAAYGDPAVLRDVLLARFHQEPGSFKILESNNVYFPRMLASQFPKIDVAAAYQHVLGVVATPTCRTTCGPPASSTWCCRAASSPTSS